jgi:hypothetical protein
MVTGLRRTVLAFAASGLLATSAGAQLSLPTFVNNSNPDEVFGGSATNPSFERESATELVSSAGGGFVTRYSSLVTVDGDGAGASAGVESLTSDYTVSFTATAPGAYRLTVDTHLSGDMHLVNDSPHGGSADVSGLSCTLTGGALESGTLGLPDPGALSGAGGGDNGIDESDTGTVFGVSNGVPVSHSLRFIFSQTTGTDGSGGDEAAVRLGSTSHVSSETAGDYPGSPARTQSDDGHFVTVSITSLCGNGVIDSGPSYTEQCDAGAQNGQPGSCCNTDCTAVTAGTACTPDSSPCTNDVCDGAGACSHPGGNDGASCDDGDPCTDPDTCSGGACVGGPHTTCNLCETCQTGVGCVVGPRPSPSCKHSTVTRKSLFQMKKGSTPASNQAQFKWLKGELTNTTDFGDPVNTDEIGLCVFAPGRVLQMIAPAGGTCGTKPCWKALSIKGFSYSDRLNATAGISKILLKAGLDGKAKAQIKGKGSALPTLPLPLTLPAIVQLQSTHDDQCWEATFSTGGKIANDNTQFKGKGD